MARLSGDSYRLRGAVAALVAAVGQQARQVHAHVARRGFDLAQQVGTADDLFQRTRAQVGQPATHFLGQQPEEVLHALGLPGEVVLAQALVLVATPVAQLLRWQMRRYLQPSTIIGAVPKPKLSAPAMRP